MLKSALILDLDGTYVRWQLFFYWIQEAVSQGILPSIVLTHAQAEYDAYRNRQGSFDKFIWAQISAYQNESRFKGIRLSDAECVAKKVVREKGNHVHVFTRTLHEAAVEAGMEVAAISGSIVQIVEAFCESRGIRMYLGTEHPHENGVFTGGKPFEWCLNKGEAALKLAEMHGLSLSESVAIGDTTSDIPMFERVLNPICFNPCARLLTIARARRWPVVWEKKDVRSYFRPDERGRLVEADLNEILPAPLADRVAEKLGRPHPLHAA